MAKKSEKNGAPSSAGFIEAVFKFFSSVRTDTVLSVLWGVEVLLFAILLLMVLFGNLSADQRFYLALAIVVSVVATFLISAWRMQAVQPPANADASAAERDLGDQATKCLALLTEIADANARNIRRGAAGAGPWGRILKDTYNNVCRTCHERRSGSAAPDRYFDAVCAEIDVKTVCDSKWQLGEALEDYRNRLNRLSWPPKKHDELEVMIRRSITQPDLSPGDLQAATGPAIEAAKRVLAGRKS
jgi:hypothetical protein